jgi:hypothetical protein
MNVRYTEIQDTGRLADLDIWNADRENYPGVSFTFERMSNKTSSKTFFFISYHFFSFGKTI